MDFAKLLATDCLNAGKDTRMLAENFEREIKRGDVDAAETVAQQIVESARRAEMYAGDAIRALKSNKS